ncbi:MAG: sigma-54-dependent Fis family transcriptional regulator [Nitrospirae bacterium]|nr:sigma-54-dependent Fis family transcriptional regulator [Nitrospirota bacterium]
MNRHRALVVDDDPHSREVLQEILERNQFEVVTADGGEAAIAAARESPFDILLTDLRMPNQDGIEVLEAIRDINPDIVGIVLTGFGTIETAVRAVKAGAFEYLTKPFKVDEVVLTVQRAIEFRQLQMENRSLKRQLRRKYRFENLIGDSDEMQKVYRMIERVADSDSTILIYGESGTGKELVARTIHYNSPRRDRPLIPVNCGAIPEDLLESELFGHEKGAFTGAHAMRMGRFELAHGGTIFLDEVGDMSPNLQVKLLRVLQEREFERVGGTRSIRVDVRVISATNKNLEEAVEQRRFREDLFYRLNVIPVTLPPMRRRREDIPLLLDHFLKRLSADKRRSVSGISPEAMQALKMYDWPGNVRELENLVERLVILKGEGVIGVEDLPDKILGRRRDQGVPSVSIPDEGVDFEKLVEDFENRLIVQAMEKAAGIKNKAAQYLRLNRTTLVEKMKRRNLQSESNPRQTAGSEV